MGKFFYYQKKRHSSELYLRHGLSYIPHNNVAGLLICEKDLRELIQLEERLDHKVTALQKAAVIEVDRTQLEAAIQQLEDARKLREMKEYSLYQWEINLDPDIKAAYDNLRCDDTWFMREELIKDCAAQGGCCGRRCGCCAKRQSSRMKIAGHCTVDCGCCINLRGYDLLETQKKERKDSFNRYMHQAGQPFLIMANSYFSPVRPWWKEIFRPKHHDKK